MKVEKLTIKHFKGIDSLDKSFAGHNVYLVGPNGSGKTSVLDAIFTTLTGKDIPTKPIKEGAMKAAVEVDLGEYIAKMDYGQSKRPKFTLTTKDGVDVKQPRTVLDDRLGVVNFDINEFLDKSDAEKVKYICNLLDVDFTEMDEQYRDLYEERTLRNRTLKQMDGTLQPYEEELVEKEEVSIAALYEEKEKITKHNTDFAEVSSGYEEAKAKLEDLRATAKELEGKIANAEGWIQDEANQPKDTDALEKQIAGAETENGRITLAKEEHKKHIEQERLTKEVGEIESEMAEIKLKKKTLIKEHLDVPGVEFDGEQLLLDGLPFEDEQVNTSRKVIAGLHMGSKLLKDVRIMRFEGSVIDRSNMKDITAWAAENDIQLAVEIVDRSGEKMELVIEEEVDNG